MRSRCWASRCAYALSPREQGVLMLTFYGNMTQAQIAGQPG